MAAITASMVKELRERTGAPMMDCKNALTETNGDLEKAVDELRKRGAAKADKKSSRVAAEGVVITAQSADAHKVLMLELNSETDFVSRDENFREFAKKVVAAALSHGAADIEAINALPITVGSDKTI